MLTRVAVGRAQAVREIRAAAPLMSQLSAPAPARGPWLTTALHAPPTFVGRAQVRAVVVEAQPQGRPVGVALLSHARRGPVTRVRLLGDGVAPPPPGAAPRRLLAADAAAAERLAAGLMADLGALRGPWRLELTGLPMGDPTAAALVELLGTGAAFATTRSRALVDRLETVGTVHRSRDAADLERVLPWLLDRRPVGGRRTVLRALARTHAAAGLLEVAVLRSGDRVTAALLTLCEGGVRLPWWGSTEVGGLGDAPGHPWVSVSASSSGTARRA